VVFNLITVKLRDINKRIQVNKMLDNDKFKEIKESLNFSSNNNDNLNNY
jgi:hypothetical protein